MTTISATPPSMATQVTEAARTNLIPFVTKVAGGALLTWSDPRGIAVAFVAQQCLNSLGCYGINELDKKFKFEPQNAMRMRVISFGLSFVAGMAIAQRTGYPTSLLSMAAGVVVLMGTNIYQFATSLKKDPFKEAEKVVAITKDNFQEEVKNAKQPVIVDVFATWCPPCKMVAPLFAKLATEMEGQVKFVKMNIDQEPELAKTLNVDRMPTFLFFKDGQEVHRAVGVITREYFAEQIERMKQAPTAG